jgi:hypothetical protein
MAFSPIGNQSPASLRASQHMNSFVIFTRAVVTAFALLNLSAISAAEPPLSVDEVAKIFGYPAARLKVEDVTEQANRRAARKGKPGGISVHSYSAHDNTFARFSIAVANEGTLLTDDIKRYVAEAIPKLRHLTGTNLHWKWLTFDEAGYGVSGLGMVGAGGSEERCIMTLFNKMDVQVTLTTGETPLEILPGAEKYHASITEGKISDKLTECLNAIASRVLDKPIHAKISATPPPRAVPEAQPNNSAPKTE